MEIIVMKSGAWRELTGRIAAIEEYIRTERVRKPTGEEIWLDNETVCAYLKISRRTLQRYRSNGTITYSLIGRKTYYAVSEISRLLTEKRVRHGDKSSEELTAKGSITLPKK